MKKIKQNAREMHLKLRNKTKYIINKLLYQYKHTNVQYIINQYIEKILIPYCEKMVQDLEQLYKDVYPYIAKLKGSNNVNEQEKIIYDTYYKIGTLFKNISNIYVLMMDLYFIRRFTDKDYITNGIVYAGGLHCADYINILVNLFNFKITHTAYAVTKNIDQLNNMVKVYHPFNNANIVETLYKTDDLFLSNGDNSVQCSDITNFPPDFS